MDAKFLYDTIKEWIMTSIVANKPDINFEQSYYVIERGRFPFEPSNCDEWSTLLDPKSQHSHWVSGYEQITGDPGEIMPVTKAGSTQLPVG